MNVYDLQTIHTQDIIFELASSEELSENGERYLREALEALEELQEIDNVALV